MSELLSELDPPAAAEPESVLDVLPEAEFDDDELGLVEPEDEVEPCGQEQFSAGELEELVPPEALVLPEVLPELLLVDGLVLGVEPDALPLAEGCEALELVDGEVPPAALEVVPELGVEDPAALPEPVDWLVCAPCVMVDDGLVVVAFWLAVAEPVDTLLSPVPTFTSAPTLAPAFTSVLLMPTFASTPTFGFTFTPPEGAVVLPDELLGCEDCEDCVLCELWSVDDDCAYAEPNTPITAAAVTLTATWRTLMITPFINADTAPRRKRCAMPVGKLPT